MYLQTKPIVLAFKAGVQERYFDRSIPRNAHTDQVDRTLLLQQYGKYVQYCFTDVKDRLAVTFQCSADANFQEKSDIFLFSVKKCTTD